MKIKLTLLVLLSFLLSACDGQSWNNPYPKKEAVANIRYSSFTERPKTLDPARAYSSNEYQIIAQIYEPPLQYHFLKRPYTLEPLTAAGLPDVKYFDANDKPVAESSGNIAYTLYTVSIKPKIYFHPHPALARDRQGNYLYHHLDEAFWDEVDPYRLSDFPQQGTRELTAADYVYQIKRLAHPEAQSPILGLMSDYIVGLGEYAKQLSKAYKPGQFLDLRTIDFAGVKQLDKYRYQIKINGKYPQFMYWLAMPFFSPMPWEADLFDSQPRMQDRNLVLDWYPLGTGPYWLTENNPNRVMVMIRNPHFHGETYPTEGTEKDEQKGYLIDAGKPLPFIDKLILTLEKESIPRWNKFLQGYYDSSGISSDSFDQAIKVGIDGKPYLTPTMKERGIRLQAEVEPTIYYFGFNMLDPRVGGYTTKARKLRQALSIAMDVEEFITIFYNGRGLPAQGPIPPGIFGYKAGENGMNPYVYHWVNGKRQRRDLAEAKKLLTEAGYPRGIDPKTKLPLILNYDIPASSGPDDKAKFDWLRKQFAKLGIQLNIRATQYNRFQQKMRNGQAQLFMWGWHADYPDPENFLFLLYGPNGKVKHGGENASNYSNPQFDKLFEKMKNMDNGPERAALIQNIINILRQDSPWIWGFHPKTFVLSHTWNRVSKPNSIAQNTLKYSRLDPQQREQKRMQWNKPLFWPIIIVLGLLLLSFIPVLWQFWHKEHKRR